MELPSRFWSKVNKDGPLWNGSPCWLWEAYTSAYGYGQFWWQGRLRQAHGAAYEAVHGPVPAGMELDHLCRVKHCVNPAHLEAVPHIVNIQRGERGMLKSAWPPCALCGDPNGAVDAGARTPARMSGVRFGIDGVLCRRCYKRLRARRPKDGSLQPTKREGQDACKYGHLLDGWNTYVTPDGKRECRTCRNEANRRYRKRRAQHNELSS